MVFDEAGAELGGPAVAGGLAHEVLAEGGLRGDEGDFLAAVFDFQAAIAGADEVEGMGFVGFEIDEGGEVDGVAGEEVAGDEGLVEFDGVEEFAGLAGLAAGQIGGFEAAGVVFAFGFAAFVGGLGVGGAGGFFQEVEALDEGGDDLLDQL